MTDPLIIKAAIQIAKTPKEVFEAIVNPEQMSNYFISESNGKMEEGKNLVWRFPEFDVDVPVRVGRIEQEKYVSYYWGEEDKELLVEMKLHPAENNSTVVHITEGKMENNEAGLEWFSGNSYGWANFLACLKAYLEFGINLRKGSFDFRREEFKERFKK